jgi:alkanesulfonate monooxygenase SsuD/methylene tetrahydromethanopterin reductase-like flavin-dependent oxidoreductase (luciferase family)
VRFSYAESMVDPSFYLPLAKAAEAVGFDGMVVPDSICYPEESESSYPFSPDHTRFFLDDKPFIEPFSLIPAMAAVTETLRFITFVIKLPIRHPLLVAKQATSVAVMTNNRLALGVGSSPWPEDYEQVDVPWEGRGKRMDESLDIVKGLSSGGYFEYHGEVYDLPSVKITPTPTEPLPILIGGHGKPALRRAAQSDGWLHGGGEPEELLLLLESLDRQREQEGTLDHPFEIHVISLDAYSADGVRRLEEQGVTDVIVGFRYPYDVGPDTETLQTKLDNMARYAEDVIEKVKS